MKTLQRNLIVMLVLALALTGLACAKQTPEMPPGAAIIVNLKSGIHVAQVATVSAKDAIPVLQESGDLKGNDLATANSIVDQVDKGLGILDQKIEPYTSFDTSNSKDIKQAVTDFLDALKKLQAEQVTHIKNPKAQARINLGLGLASGALALWQPQGA